MRNDSTLILRAKPGDPTPEWVGEPAAEPLEGVTAPWQESREAVPFDMAAEETAAHTLKLRLVASDPGTLARLERDAGWRDQLPPRLPSPGPLRRRMIEELMTASMVWRPERVGVSARDAHARLAPAPVALVEGTLAISLCDVERLRSTTHELLLQAASDPAVQAWVERARAFAALPEPPQAGARAMLDEVTGMLGEPSQETRRRAEQVERGLWVRRQFQRAELLGILHTTGELRVARGEVVRSFLSQGLIETLHEGPTLRGRFLIALEMAEQDDVPMIAARVLAIARSVP